MQRQRIDSSEETQSMNALFIKISKTNSSREETILKLEIVLYDGHMYGLIPKPNKVTQKKKIFQRHICRYKSYHTMEYRLMESTKVVDLEPKKL